MQLSMLNYKYKSVVIQNTRSSVYLCEVIQEQVTMETSQKSTNAYPS